MAGKSSSTGERKQCLEDLCKGMKVHFFSAPVLLRALWKTFSTEGNEFKALLDNAADTNSVVVDMYNEVDDKERHIETILVL